MNFIIITLITTLFIVYAGSISAQIFVEKDLEQGVTYMVEYIISNEFVYLASINNDLDLIDSLYLRALHYHNYDIEEALLTLTFTTLPFREMPLHLPFTNVRLSASLPSGPDKTLEKKIKNVPKKIFSDSPNTKFGDKDKVAHFFGNAFLSYSITIFNMSKFLSILVELFEDSFKVEGTIDNRDFIANYLGDHFGKQLLDNENFLPSTSLSLYNFFKLNYCY